MCGGGILKSLLPIALSIAGAEFGGPALATGLNISKAAGAALGGGIGSFGGNLATGHGVGDSLKNAVISGGGSYLGSQLFGGGGLFNGGEGAGGEAFGPPMPESFGPPMPTSMSSPVGGGTTGGFGASASAAPAGAGFAGGGFGGGDITSEFRDAFNAGQGTSFGSAASSVGGSNPGTQALGAAASEGPSSFSKFIDNPGFSTGFNMLKDNSSLALGAAALGANALRGDQPLHGEGAINSLAQQEAARGEKLQQYLESGTLPPGLQHGINQATEAAKATIRSQYASRGMSGSSAEQQDLMAVDQRAQAQGAQMAMNLLNTGINETGMASQLYQLILNQSLQKDKDLGAAISAFGSSAAGGSPGGNITINTGHA